MFRTDRQPGLDLIAPSTRYVLTRILNAIIPLFPTLAIAGTSDLAAGSVKVSGSAQQRKRRFFLHHGTLLAGFDLPQLARYLNAPERQPDYRRGRPHVQFVGNLPTTTGELKRRQIAEWQPEGDANRHLQRVRELVARNMAATNGTAGANSGALKSGSGPAP